MEEAYGGCGDVWCFQLCSVFIGVGCKVIHEARIWVVKGGFSHCEVPWCVAGWWFAGLVERVSHDGVH